MKEFDLVNRLNFLLEALYYDGIKTNNKIVFNYSPIYPRKFILQDTNIIKIIEYGAKIFLYSTKNAKIVITFKLTNYDINVVYFRVFIKIAKNLENLNEKYIKKAKDIAKKLGVNIIIKKDEILIDIKMQLLPNAKDENIKLKSTDIKKYKAIIACNDIDTFEILSSNLKTIGIDIKPKSDYQTLIKHLKDAIYKPNLVFLAKKIIDNKSDFEEILNLKRMKKFQIIAICENNDSIDESIKKDIFILRQPYTYDILCTILNATYTKQINEESSNHIWGGV